MSIPTQPTETTIMTKAYRLYGKSPTSNDVTNARDSAMAMVKSDMMDEGREWSFMRKVSVRACTINKNSIQAPTDFSKLISAVVCDGTRYSTAQTGSTTSITLDATDSSTSAEIVGKDIAIKSGTGANQVRQIIAYDASTKIATVETWTAPDNTSTYLIIDEKQDLYLKDIWTYDELKQTYLENKPHYIFHQADDAEGDFLFDYTPDKEYVVLLRYYADLRKEDTDTGTNVRYARILRLVEQLFIQGAFVYLLQDDSRTAAETSKYASMLQRAAGQYLKMTMEVGLAEDIY